MTEIFIDHRQMFLESKGHAGSDEAGKDIVCAAISVLTQTLVNALREERDIEFDFDIEEEQGLLRVSGIRCWGVVSRKRAEDYFRMTVIGLRAIAQNYPEYVSIKEVE